MHTLPSAITGDRPTGPLHLGHYAGSLRNRVQMQNTHALTVLIADLQALTDRAGQPQNVASFIPELMKDYLAVGLDPGKVRFVLQSAVPELCELTVLLLNLATVAQLERNPTVRSEISMRGFARDIPAGFLCYPVSQAADILGLGAGMVPVGDDQLPMIEITNLLGERINRLAGKSVMPRAQALLSNAPRLPGIGGGAKMSKSGNNAIAIGCNAKQLRAAVHQMYTDPGHLRIEDPGRVEGNVVFSFLDAFDPDPQAVQEMKEHYRRGGLGDSVVKKRLAECLEAQMAPIRERRMALDGRENELMQILDQGSRQAREQARACLEQVRGALGMATLRRA